MCTLLLNMCVVGLVEIGPDLYRVELLDPVLRRSSATYNVREYVLIRSDAQPIRAEPDKK